jgi:peptidoglycan/xylan/chitin deacetylase (PgdA/CDA1 family)
VVGRASKPRTILIGLAVLLVVAGVGAASVDDVRAARGEQPLVIQSATLAQDGEDLVWQVELAQPFSPAALSSDGRSVCLLLRPGSSGSPAGAVCLAGPGRDNYAPRVLYTPTTGSGPGRTVPIDASVTRTSDRELTASFVPTSIGLEYRALRWQVISTLSARRCAPAPRPGGCETVFPARLAELSLHKPRLVGCVATGPNWVSHGPNGAHEIALTFDDGPWWEPPTGDFVRLLARLHAPATFFEIGEHIGQYDRDGEVEREMLADGDMIGDHTWSHPDLLGLSPAEQRDQISLAAKAIRKATGFTPCLFRAPDGAVDNSVLQRARALGFATIQWDIDPRDWALPGEGEIIANVLSSAHNGGIIEEHFGGGPRYETLDALPAEIAGLRREGFHLVTLTQMLGYKLVYR